MDKDTQPYAVQPEANEVKPIEEENKDQRETEKAKRKVGKALKKAIASKSVKDRQVEMFAKPKKERMAVWTKQGSREWNSLRYKLHSLIIEAKREGKSDTEAFCCFADNEEVLNLIKNHPNQSVRDWNRDRIIESAEMRMKQDLESIIRDKSVPSVKSADDLPEHYPLSLLVRTKKKNPLHDFLVKAGGKI